MSSDASLNVLGTQISGGVKGTAGPGGYTVAVSEGLSGSILSAAQGTILAPLIDSFAHINSTFNSPAGEDLVAVRGASCPCAGRQVGKQLKLSPKQCLPMVVPFERFGNTSSSSTWCAGPRHMRGRVACESMRSASPDTCPTMACAERCSMHYQQHRAVKGCVSI